ncbi:MAG: redoxin domain-containing protein, partial [bacterium]
MISSLSALANTLSRGHLGHVHPAELSQFAHGDGTASHAVLTHLAHCPQCRGEVAFLRSARAEAAQVSGPVANDALLQRVLARHAAGERSIIAVDDPAPPRNTSRRASRIVGTAIAATLIIGFAVSGPRESTAGNSEGTLRFSDTLVHRGDRIRVTYRAPVGVAGHDSLVLRAGVRTPTSGSYGSGSLRVAAMLHSNGKGEYAGEFQFPTDAVYASFAVETPDASWVDSHELRLWHIAECAPYNPAMPSYEALDQHSNDNMGRSWEAAFAAAKEAARRYPDRVGSWYHLAFFQAAVLGTAATDSLRKEHLPRLRAFHTKLSAQKAVPANDMGEMFFYARSEEDTVIAHYWHDRLEREWPADPFTVQNRIVDIPMAVRQDSLRALAAYDGLYQELAATPSAFDRQGESLLRLGLWAAVSARDADAAARWGARYLEHRRAPDDSAWVSGQLVALPALRDAQLDRLRSLARTALGGSDGARPLRMTAIEWRRELEGKQSRILATIGHSLVMQGSKAAGADSLDIAARRSWSVSLMRQAATAWSAAGDTARVAQNLARIAVDPATSPATLDSLTRTLHVAPDRLTPWTNAARSEMREIVMRDGTRMTLRGDPALQGLSGGRVGLRSLVNGQPTIVTFWSRFCGPSLDQLPKLEKLWATLHARGIGLVAITDEAITPDLRDFIRQKGLSIPVYNDVQGDAMNAFSNFGTPSYFILDDEGVVR